MQLGVLRRHSLAAVCDVLGILRLAHVCGRNFVPVFTLNVLSLIGFHSYMNV